MKSPATQRTKAKESSGLRREVQRAVWPVFRNSSSPKLLEPEVRNAVGLLFELLDLKLGDPSLDNVGPQIVEGLSRYFGNKEYTKIADRFEPFAKFVLKLTRPKQYADLAAKLHHRFTLGVVLQECGLAEELEIKAWAACPWQQFPPGDLRGKPGFKEPLGWTYRYRNTEDHLAPELDGPQQAKVAQSVCVSFVWLVAKFTREIQPVLLRTRFSEYLRRVRDDPARTTLATKGVELSIRPRSAEEYRVANPSLPLLNAPAAEEGIGVFKLPERNRVTVIEGEAGAGKTAALELIAWHAAERLLKGEDHTARLPVFVRLKACRSSIAARVREALNVEDSGPPPGSVGVLAAPGGRAE